MEPEDADQIAEGAPIDEEPQWLQQLRVHAAPVLAWRDRFGASRTGQLLRWTGLLMLAVATFGIASYWSGAIWWRFEILSHFFPYYGIVAAVAAAVLLLTRPWGLVPPAIGLVALQMAMMIQGYSGAPEPRLMPWPSETGRTFSLLHVNVLGPSDGYAPIRALIASEDADVVSLQELTEPWLEALHETIESYPYRAITIGDAGHGLGILSKFPAALEAKRLSPEEPMLRGMIDIDGMPLAVLAMHPSLPLSAHHAALRNEQLDYAERYGARYDRKAALVVGDLNTTVWSPLYRRLERNGGFRNVQRDTGWLQSTWPSHGVVPGFPLRSMLVAEGLPTLAAGWIPDYVSLPVLPLAIDHVLVNHRLRTIDVRVGAQTESDHFPLIVELEILPPRSRSEPTIR